MADTGAVKFEGQPPFLLPEAKSAQADLFERSVVVTLYSEVEGQGPALVSIVFHKRGCRPGHLPSPTFQTSQGIYCGPRPRVGAFLATACRSGEMAARQGARTGLGCRPLGPLGLSTFDKSPGHPLVGAFPLCARSATGYANSLVGNQAPGFRLTILLARAAENPATGTKRDGVAGFFLGDMAMSIVKELGFSLAIAVAVVAGLRFVFLMCEWAFA
jgi:hypothetical protein